MTFETALAFVLQWEGGFVNNPNDPGGATNKGVTQRTYDGWRVRRAQTKRDVRAITEAEVRAIYEVDYWLAAHCDQIPSPLDLVQFDTAVNIGVGRAVKLLQRTLGLTQDGEFGPLTRSAAAEAPSRSAAVSYCVHRMGYYNELVARNAKLATFLNGWRNRVIALEKAVSA